MGVVYENISFFFIDMPLGKVLIKLNYLKILRRRSPLNQTWVLKVLISHLPIFSHGC